MVIASFSISIPIYAGGCHPITILTKISRHGFHLRTIHHNQIRSEVGTVTTEDEEYGDGMTTGIDQDSDPSMSMPSSSPIDVLA
jgi:hypothetical protein